MFRPKPCPCGCKKWIMAPIFACQCSSVSMEQKEELIAMALDAERYRALDGGPVLDAVADSLIARRGNAS